MRYAVEIALQAAEDLQGIYDYIAYGLQSPVNAERQISRIEREILSLRQMPERYKVMELDYPPERAVRMVTVDRFCVIYHVDKARSTVVILRVLYGGRDLASALTKG